MMKLYYFPLRARGEAVKMILSYGKVPFENVYIQLHEWPAVKAQKALCPFGQLPSLQLTDGTVLCQSGSLVRYAAKLAGVYPSDPLAAAQADVIFELSQEMNLINPVLNFFAKDTEQWQKSKDTYFNNQLPERAAAAESILGDKQFFGGEIPSFGDFGLFHILQCTVVVEPHSLDAYPHLVSWMQRMRSLPELESFFAERPPKYGAPNSLAESMTRDN